MKFEEVRANEPAKSLSAGWLNKIIKCLNTLLVVEVTPSGLAAWTATEANIKLDLSALAKRLPPPPPGSGTYVLTSTGGKLEWTETAECP